MDVAAAEAVCYVCYGDGKEEALISPCAGCRGSTAFIHFSCLRDFVGQRGDWTNLVCPTCKYAYEGEAAVKLAEEGLRKAEPSGKDTRLYVDALRTLLQVHLRNKNFTVASDIGSEALVATEHVYGTDHDVVADVLVQLSVTRRCLGDYAKAREMQERALVIKEHVYGEDHQEVGRVLVFLADAYTEIRDLAKARELRERALVITEHVYGENHEKVALVLMYLSVTYTLAGDNAKARELLERALVITEHVYGKNHRKVATLLADLGVSHRRLGNH